MQPSDLMPFRSTSSVPRIWISEARRFSRRSFASDPSCFLNLSHSFGCVA